MEWIKVFSSMREAKARLSGRTTQLLIIKGKRICLAQHNENFYAVQDRCSHNGESLSKGVINFKGEIVCPWHNYRFDLLTGEARDSSSPDLEVFPIKTDDTGFFIGI
jgi:nitrite reductase/ring-hydroxylating ferredoxin subunit